MISPERSLFVLLLITAVVIAAPVKVRQPRAKDIIPIRSESHGAFLLHNQEQSTSSVVTLKRNEAELFFKKVDSYACPSSSFFPSIPTRKKKSEHQFLEVVLDRHSTQDTFTSWSREFWIKNGLLGEIGHNNHYDVTLRASTHSLASVLFIQNLFVISDQTTWNTQQEWNLPNFFEVSSLHDHKASKNVFVYDMSENCNYENWYGAATVVFKEYICTFTGATNATHPTNVVWVPFGWRDLHTVKWNPRTFTASSERAALFVVSSSESNFAATLVAEEIFDTARGLIQPPTQPAWKTHLELRNSAFVICDHINSHCIYDGLMNGVIPILKWGNHEIAIRLFGDVPFPIVPSQKIGAFLRYFQSDVESLDSLQKRVVSWWESYYTCLQSTVRSKIHERLFAARHEPWLGQ